MFRKMRKTVLITAIGIGLALAGLFGFVTIFSDKNKSGSDFGVATRGNFEINTVATGELVPENATDIKGPDIVQNRNFRAGLVKILDLVPEGTEVNKGDFIASLDRTTFDNRLKDETDALKTIRDNFNLVILDSAITLAELRDEIKDQYYIVREAATTVNNSIYESSSVQSMARLELDKSKRQFDQLKNNYKLKLAQTLEGIKVLKLSLNTQLRVVDDLKKVLKEFTITAPSHGMVIYKKDVFGNKITAGSMLNPFNPVVASLYDLSFMHSKIYVSEIEINKIRAGQEVEISVDAFPGKAYTGKVTSIANIGEQLLNSDSKVFEVEVKLDGTDQTLRPSMTTNNKIIINTFNNVVYVPLESVQAGPDSIPFVYTREWKKQVIIPGESNDKDIIVKEGLADGTSVWLTTPDNPAKFRLTGKDLIAVIKGHEHTVKLASGSSVKERPAVSKVDAGSKNAGPGSVISGSQVIPGSY